MDTSVKLAQLKETIRGMIVPAQWDEQFRVTGVLIACDDEREVHIENSSQLPGLLSRSKSEALLTGIVRKLGGAESMLVESFTILENNKPLKRT